MRVLEVGDREFWPPRTADGIALVTEWLAAHGVDASDTFRVEVHAVDPPFLRVSRFATNTEGKRFVDPQSELPDCDHGARHCWCPLEVAKAAPFDVAMRMPPPVPFRTVGGED